MAGRTSFLPPSPSQMGLVRFGLHTDDPTIEDTEYLLAMAEERSIELEIAYRVRRAERRRRMRRDLCELLKAQIQRLMHEPFSWQVNHE